MPNSYADSKLASSDFINFRYFLEVYSKNGETPEYIEEIAHILQDFWDRGWDAVAACDFESALPRSGG
jgi:hypothetical protein